MSSFYGKSINHIPRTNFKFAKRYNNRVAMVQDIEVITDSGQGAEMPVAYGDYVLVDYSHGNSTYLANQNIDIATYGSNNFDLTVWQVQPIQKNDANGNYIAPRCVAIARIHSVLPMFEIRGQYQIDLLQSISDGDYFGQGKNIFPLDVNTNLPVEV